MQPWVCQSNRHLNYAKLRGHVAGHDQDPIPDCRRQEPEIDISFSLRPWVYPKAISQVDAASPVGLPQYLRHVSPTPEASREVLRAEDTSLHLLAAV